jgi:2-aminoadipate transaminase
MNRQSLPPMDWTERLTPRARALRRSAVRELLKVTTRPEIISLAGGLPAPELFPVDAVRAATEAVLTRRGSRALQYGETEGVAELRERVAAEVSGPGGARWTREHVVITSGAQQALDLLGRVLVDEGDRVLVENPTYLALLSAWGSHGARFLGLPGDADGLCVDALPAPGTRPAKLLYTIPNFQNPQGTTLAPERRPELVRWARAAGVGVVEDDPYGELWYDREPGPSLFATEGDGGNVIRCGTFSKVLAPGLRVGWVVGSEAVVERLVLAKQAADLHSGTLNQWVALELLENGTLEAQRPRLRAEYRRRRDAMLDALERHFPAEARWTRPAGGMFVFVTLPEGRDAATLLPRALEQGVAFVPGESFHVDGGGRNTLRLNFTNADPGRIEEGIRRLGTVVAAG